MNTNVGGQVPCALTGRPLFLSLGMTVDEALDEINCGLARARGEVQKRKKGREKGGKRKKGRKRVGPEWHFLKHLLHGTDLNVTLRSFPENCRAGMVEDLPAEGYVRMCGIGVRRKGL